MPKPRDSSTDEIPFDQHPLYQAALEQLAKGDEEQARTNLNLLAEFYPDEQAIGDLLLRQELRAAFVTEEQVPVEHRRPTPILRQILLALLAILLAFMGMTLFLTAYNRFVYPTRQSKQQDTFIQWLRRDGQQRLDAGDWSGARQVFEELLTQEPGDPTAQAAIELITEREMWDRVYVDAMSAKQRGDWQTALDLLYQIQTYDAEYRDVQYHIETVQMEQTLEAGFLEAQALVQAEDWLGAITVLERIRGQNPDFRRTQVEDMLYQLYSQLAMPPLDQANGNVDMLREAIGYMKEALALQPTNRDLLEEYRLAAGFVDGADAYAEEDWVSAVSHWEPVYVVRPDYQGGILEGLLRQAYPLATRHLIAQANGDADRLHRAIAYLNRALFLLPGDESLIEERRLAIEYVTGAEAFSQEDWNGAIIHWGPIYADYPDYQEGVLEENLRRACLNSMASDTALCPP